MGNYASGSRNGILSQGNFANITGNAGIANRKYGIFASGSYVGPFPGEQGHGYYKLLTDSVAILNTVGGINCAFPHGIIRYNSVFQNLNNGTTLGGWCNNTTVYDNYISDNPVGIVIPDRLVQLSVVRNLVRTDNGSAFLLTSGTGAREGAIYDNIISADLPVKGTGAIGAFSWINPAGPTPGTSIMDGPFIAGNYWTNENDTGWSDLQPANPAGYTTTPYPVAAGINDTAPLVRVGGTPMSAVARFQMKNMPNGRRILQDNILL